jgi:hypothetical protein
MYDVTNSHRRRNQDEKKGNRYPSSVQGAQQGKRGDIGRGARQEKSDHGP